MPSFNARSAYMQNGQRDRSASVDTELGAWDADRYYYAGQTSGMGDSGMGENAPYDTLDSPPAGVTHGKTTRADDGERSNVFDLGDDEEEDTTLSGGQRE
ncbi:hypothetical protein QFC19_006806 [Naganishia cerealis]|uniref:Uncharacterized protein n=1 Tax=Naganishia cerealis TaxID=610337 RepID=A0ACC2VFT0_9TREE|nr:hypothetical protein QFC19_006806 [Naganishia cerealis]